MERLIQNFLRDASFESNIISIVKDCFEFVRKDNKQLLEKKTDGSPLCKADIGLDNIITKGLERLNSKIPLISEEKLVSVRNYLDDYYWLIDPIDGTKSYLSGGKEYSINIALIVKGEPLFGLIAHPPTENIWYSKDEKLIVQNKGHKRILEYKPKKFPKYPSIITSKEFNQDLEKFVNAFQKNERIKLSSSLKFCELAEKRFDIYPRFSSISKWDIAAGHAILRAAGGDLVKIDGKHFRYNTITKKTGSFIAYSDKSWRSKLVLNFQ